MECIDEKEKKEGIDENSKPQIPHTVIHESKKDN